MNSKSFPKFAVLGAGHGGKTMAAHLGLMGFSVNLYNYKDVEEEYLINLDKIREKGGIELEGIINGFGRINIASSNIKDVIEDVNVIMVVVPAFAHKYIAKTCAPHLQDNQIIVLNPGRTGGALEFKKVLEEEGVTAKVKVAEAQTLIYTCRSVNYTRVKVFSVKKSVPIAGLPATETKNVLKVISEAYPQFVPASSVLETSLNNIGAVFHPALTLLNSARIEMTKGDFEFYIDGASPHVCKVLEAVDEERIRIAKALDVNVTTLKKWLKTTYGVEGKSLFEALQNNTAYKGIKAPSTLKHRYIFEDVPTGLVPISSLGSMLDISTPTIDALINLACAMFGVNFWEQGRTVEKLGLAGLSIEEIKKLVLGQEVK
ncbi:NADP transhydrogenase subunit alpha [Candidatus Bathyarchaeota archaeon]|mgnify:CR=1 FL=1|nr:MAG: NADP transhydrogenase subunit alpha [Candidatus Bathyarchaeota archaeon]